jgi:hypothetical protein
MWRRTIVVFPLGYVAIWTAIGCASAAQTLNRPAGKRSTSSQPPRRIVELEVSSSDTAAVESQQRWMNILSEIGADRVRSVSRNQGEAQIIESQSSQAILIKVQGVIQGEKLLLPGKTFSIRDQSALRDYVNQLRTDGAEVALAEKKAFGLTSQQLVEVNERLGVPLDVSTIGKTIGELVSHVRSKLEMPLEIQPSANFKAKQQEQILDELQGLSFGTVLAAALRPVGLVVTVQRNPGGQTILSVVDYREAEEHWPVGWPSDSIPKNVVPEMFVNQAIEIRGFALDQVLQAIQVRAKVPMLLDHNSLARAGIELDQTKVTFVKERASYMHALGKVLNQTKPRMKYEIRVDEGGKPFLWISTSAPRR